MDQQNCHSAFMGEEPLHPITTPKGTSAVSVLLAVIGAFSPFVAGLLVALVIAFAAVCVIFWLYAKEVAAFTRGQQSFSGLWLPTACIVIVVGMAGFAGWNVANQPAPKPAITIPDIVAALKASSPAQIQPPPKSEPSTEPVPTLSPPATREREYIVIKQPLDTPPAKAPAPRMLTPQEALGDDYVKETSRRLKRDAVRYEASGVCNRNKGSVQAGLVRLQNDAIGYQNTYARYRSKSQMVNDLAIWKKEVEQFLQENKDTIPDISLFDIANYDAGRSIFVGDGQRAWYTMEQKKKSLAAMEKAVQDIPCDKIGKAAVVECEDSGNCQ